MKIEIVDPLAVSGWDKLVQTQKSYTIFHSSCWLKVLKYSYKYRPLAFLLIKESKPIAIIPVMEIESCFTGMRGVALPFSDYCPPLFDATIENVEGIVRRILEYGREAGWKYFELRGGYQFGSMTHSQRFMHHVLILKGNEQEIFAKFRDNTKRNIRKSIKEKIEIQFTISSAALKKFYQLHCLTRKHHSLPPQPFSFFKNIQKYVFQTNSGHIIQALHKKRVIASSIYFHFGKSAIYKYGASDPAYLKYRPNNRVMWEAIKWYIYNGYESFSFGRTDPTNLGLIRFKNGWGAQKEIIDYYRFNLVTKAEKATRKIFHGISIFKKTPLPLLRLLGKFLYRHFG